MIKNKVLKKEEDGDIVTVEEAKEISRKNIALSAEREATQLEITAMELEEVEKKSTHEQTKNEAKGRKAQAKADAAEGRSKADSVTSHAKEKSGLTDQELDVARREVVEFFLGQKEEVYAHKVAYMEELEARYDQATEDERAEIDVELDQFDMDIEVLEITHDVLGKHHDKLPPKPPKEKTKAEVAREEIEARDAEAPPIDPGAARPPGVDE